MGKIEKELAKRMLVKDEGIQPGMGTPFQTASPVRGDETEEVYREGESEIGITSPAPAPAPMQAMGSPVPAVGAVPIQAPTMQEEGISSTGGYSTQSGMSARYNPQSQSSGDNVNQPARDVLEVTAKREEVDEAVKALTGLQRAIVSKYLGRDPATAQAISKEFDDTIKDIYQPHGGSDNFVNTRTVGQHPAKFSAGGDDPSNASNYRGKLPATAAGISATGGKPPASYDAYYDQAFRNGTDTARYPVDAGQERYRHITQDAGNSSEYPQPKPDRDPRLRATNPYHSQPGAAVPSHPTTSRDVAVATYEKPVRVLTQTGEGHTRGDFSGAKSLGDTAAAIGSGYVPTNIVKEVHRHGEKYENFEDKTTVIPESLIYANPDQEVADKLYKSFATGESERDERVSAEDAARVSAMSLEDLDPKVLEKTIVIRLPKGRPKA